MTFHTTTAQTTHFGHTCRCVCQGIARLDWARLAGTLACCTVCLLRIVAPHWWELRGMRTGLKSICTCSHTSMNVCMDGGFGKVGAIPPPAALPLATGSRDGRKVERQPALALVSDFGRLRLVFFRKHLLGLQLHQRKRSPTSLPGRTAKVTLHSGERGEECVKHHQEITLWFRWKEKLGRVRGEVRWGGKIFLVLPHLESDFPKSVFGSRGCCFPALLFLSLAPYILWMAARSPFMTTWEGEMRGKPDPGAQDPFKELTLFQEKRECESTKPGTFPGIMLQDWGG